MTRLPIPGQDQGNWGAILNDFLAQTHDSDGSIKSGAITETALAPSIQTKLNSVAGPTGATGPQGVQGVAGATGASGAQGIVGAPGATGSQGIQGIQGATGAQGIQGATGPQGITGSTGATGSSGSTGASGPAGTSVTITGNVANAAALPGGLTVGDAGKGYLTQDDGHLHVWSGTAWVDVGLIRGPQGLTGPQGIQGIQGATGTQGNAGIQGATGPAGVAGTTGATGASGVGAIGATGPQGTAGTGGATGATGPAGTAGTAGSTGATGAAGNPWQYGISPKIVWTGSAWPSRASSIPAGYAGTVEYWSATDSNATAPTDRVTGDIWTRVATV